MQRVSLVKLDLRQYVVGVDIGHAERRLSTHLHLRVPRHKRGRVGLSFFVWIARAREQKRAAVALSRIV